MTLRSRVALSLTSAALLFQVTGITQQTSEFDRLNQLAQSNNLPVGNLEVQSRSTIVHPETGVTLQVMKVMDRASGQVYVTAADQSGRAADPAQAVANEAKLRSERYGKLDRALSDRVVALERSPGGGAPNIPVSIWLNISSASVSRPEISSEEQVAPAVNATLSALEQHVSGARARVFGQIRSMDRNATAGRYSPTAFAELGPAQIRQLERDPDITAMYVGDRNTRFNDDMTTTARTHRVWAAGNTGFGMSSRIAVHEDDGVADFNPLLNNLSHPVMYFCAAVNALCPFGKNIDDHATVVAGNVAATHPLYAGHAPNSQVILSANSQNLNNDAQNVAAFEWAVGNGAGVVNLSWGQNCPNGAQNFASRYADWATRVLAITQTISSGNRRGCVATDDLLVSMPGGAFNVITVGAHSDNSNGFWFDDAMAGFSRYKNPNSGANKPEVVSVGVNLTSTDSQGGDHLGSGWDGTSFSSPSVAGTAMLMLSRQPGQRFWPETNKAAIMASAMHDIVGGFFGDDQDGAGAVVSTVADDTYRNGRFRNASISLGNMNQSCGPLGGAAVCFNYLNAFTAVAGARTRVAIAWDAIADPWAATSQLGADIDLCIVHPNNVGIVACSSSFSDPYEVVEFIAPAAGAYDIYIRRFSSVAGWPGTFIGTAWSFGNTTTLPNFCAGEQSVSVAAAFTGNIVRTVNTQFGGTYFDAYTGWGFNQTGREGLIKLTLASTRTVQLSDTNGNLDLHLLQLTGSGCDGNPVTYNRLLSTINGPATRFNVAPGTYYVVVDGFNGAVGSTPVTINISPPSLILSGVKTPVETRP